MHEDDKTLIDFDVLAAFEQCEILPKDKPYRARFPSPKKGGPTVGQVRKAVRALDVHAFFGVSDMWVTADIDPSKPAGDPIVALDMIARSDAAGLERAVRSALPFVDEVIIGIDGRSDAETRLMAEQYADVVHVFHAADIELSAADWAADKIHFANARNIGRRKVTAPWVLFLDTDEVLIDCNDLRSLLPETDCTTFQVEVCMEESACAHKDAQRLARTTFSWRSQTHNQLIPDRPQGQCKQGPVVARLLHDVSVRDAARRAQRNAQRREGIKALLEPAEAGDTAALFHLGQHAVSTLDVDEALKWIQKYRFHTQPHGAFADDRAWLAVCLAQLYYQHKDDLVQGEVWALRALFDGPCIEAFCVLGDIAEDAGDLQRALAWYEAACSVTSGTRKLQWNGPQKWRWGRCVALKMAVLQGASDPEAVRPLPGVQIFLPTRALDDGAELPANGHPQTSGGGDAGPGDGQALG